MITYYEGYKFNENSNSVFNPDMSMYFLDNYLAYNKYPKEMIDNNVKTDYGKVNQLAYNFNDREALEEIMTTGETSTMLVDRFNIHTMYSIKENFKSLLFYLGMLTIKEQGSIGTVLKIPNHVIKTIYWEQYFQKINEDYNIQIQDIRIAVNEMRMHGNIEHLIELIKNILNDLSNRDLIQMDEKHVKMMILTLLGVPQLIVEVLSPGNAEDDTIKKKEVYEKFRVPEYWIASPISRKIYIYNLENDRYKLSEEYNFKDELIQSVRFEDLKVDIKDIELLDEDEEDI